MFKKTFYSPVAGTNISERIFPKDLVMHYKTKSMERCFRKTHIIELYPNEIEERIRSGLFLEYDYQRASGDDGRENDEDAPHTFYEQHRLWDLDDDGYKEPYIVTYHKDSQKVARIVAGYDIDSISASAKNNLSAKRGKVQRIEPIEYFTKFPFMPSPDGSIYDIGFGTLQTPINKIINQATNLLLDSGTIATLGGGFLGRGINLGRNRDSGPILFKPGEWKSIKVSGDDLRKGIVPLPVKEPSNVLFLLLGMMIEAGEKMSSVADVLTGESPGQEVPATTTLALIEQGLKVFNAVYGRVHRSLASEFKKHYKLNKKHLAPHTYYTVGDDVKEMPRKEFDDSDCDVQPVSDPTESTDTQRLIKAEALGSMMGQGLNDKKIQRRKLEAMNIPDIDELLVDDDGKPIPPPQDPKAVAEQQKQQMEQQKVQMEAQFKQQEHQLKVAEFQMKFEKNQQDIIESRTKCILNIAKAEAAENGPQVDMYKTQLKSIDERYKANAQRMVAARGNAAGGQGNGAPNS